LNAPVGGVRRFIQRLGEPGIVQDSWPTSFTEGPCRL